VKSALYDNCGNSIMTKCPRCKIRAKEPGGYCRPCKNEYMRKFYKNKKKTVDDIVMNRKYRMIASAKRRSKKHNVIFELTLDSFDIPEFCPVLGIKLSLKNKTVQSNSPTLDKFIPNLGYVEGNVAVISHKANVMKSNATVHEVEKLLTWMKTKI
jgi:hypothetical protein